MITLIVALIFYALDPMLGIIVGLALPAVIALDSTGEYKEVLVGIILATTFYFIRKTAYHRMEDD